MTEPYTTDDWDARLAERVAEAEARAEHRRQLRDRLAAARKRGKQLRHQARLRYLAERGIPPLAADSSTARVAAASHELAHDQGGQHDVP